MTTVRPVRATWDVPEAWRDGPFGDLLAYHDLGKPGRRFERAELLVGTCMDHRIDLRLPPGFAYVLRVGGANLSPVLFQVSYAIALKGVRHLAVVAHTGCGTAGLAARRAEFVRGLVANGGWEADAAGKHFDTEASFYDLADPVLFAARQARRLAIDYPGLATAAFVYDLSDGMLSIVEG